MSSNPYSGAALREQVLHECVAMMRYALASGMNVSPSVANTIEQARFAPANQPMDMAPIVKAHDHLARLVAPATPRALLVMGDEHSHGSRLAWAGSVGLVRRMMLAAIISVLLFLVLSATEATSAPETFSNGFGPNVLANELFWMAAAGMGASFSLLRQVNEYIVQRTYDPKYEPTYWIKFILGVMAGFIMAALLPDVLGLGAGAAGAVRTAGAAGVDSVAASAKAGAGMGSTTLALAVPTLAMLGGFSASAVFQILTKLVESVENVFRSSPGDVAAQREKAAQTKAGEEISATRLNVASQIVKLQQQIAAGTDPEAINRALTDLARSLVPGAAPETPETPAPETPAPADSTAATTIVLPPNTPIVAAPVDTPPSDAAVTPATPGDAAPADDAAREATADAPAAVGAATDDAPAPEAGSSADFAAGSGSGEPVAAAASTASGSDAEADPKA